MTPYGLRPRLPKRKIRYNFRSRQPKRLQGNKRTRDDAEEETLLPIIETPLPIIETPQAPAQALSRTPAPAPEEQHAPQGSPGSCNHAEGISYVKSHPKKGRTQRFLICVRDAPPSIQKAATSTLRLNNVLTEPEIPSSSEVPVHEHPILSKLKPPSRSEGFNTGEDYVGLLQKASSVLISEINKTSDSNQMMDISCKTFSLLDSLDMNYMQLYDAVYSVVRQQCEIEALNKQKPHRAFATKDVHQVTKAEFIKAKKRMSEVDIKFKEAGNYFDAIAAHIHRLEDEIHKAKEDKARLGEKLAAARAEKVSCEELYSAKKSEFKSIAAEMAEAQPVLDDFNGRYTETLNRLNRAKDELSRLRI